MNIKANTLIITVLAGLFTSTTALSLATITVHKNNKLESSCSRLCNTIEGCIGKAMELDRKGGNNGRYKSIVIRNNGKVVFTRNYQNNNDFRNMEAFYSK